MLLALLSVIPVGLGLSLLAFGIPERPLLSPSPRNLTVVGLAAVVLGPLAQVVLGFVGWLVLVALVIVGLVLATGFSGPPRQGALQE